MVFLGKVRERKIALNDRRGIFVFQKADFKKMS
jgi:hypothetical protein